MTTGGELAAHGITFGIVPLIPPDPSRPQAWTPAAAARVLERVTSEQRMYRRLADAWCNARLVQQMAGAYGLPQASVSTAGDGWVSVTILPANLADEQLRAIGEQMLERIRARCARHG